MLKNVDVLLVALSSPIQIGIYENHQLIQRIESDEKSSDILPQLFDSILKKYHIENLFYANGPGSFMAIKVAYIFLKSIMMVESGPLYYEGSKFFVTSKGNKISR